MEHNLEIGLFRWDATQFGVDLRYEAPGDATEVRPQQSAPFRLDPSDVRPLELDVEKYGECLWERLFSDDKIRATFEAARARAAINDPATRRPAGLRVRFYISANAPELHRYRWETLRDPVRQAWLATNEQTLFSRYLLTNEWRTLGPGPAPGARPRVVLAVAAPQGLEQYRPNGEPLHEINVDEELARARAALAGYEVTELSPQSVAGAAPRRATIANLVQAVRDGHHILYLICHGALIAQEPVLYLEKDNGQLEATGAKAFLEPWRDLAMLPRLVVLASCQSAGGGREAQSRDGGALAALGPRLVEIGVPAVVAMQGNVLQETARQFGESFFRELSQGGVVDRAMAIGRSAIRQRPDWWSPTLFMRLKAGQLWDDTRPRNAGAQPDWDTLVGRLRKGECTPIIGNGVLEPLIGSTRELARRWAEVYRFPLAPHDRDDLPQVAQYLEVAKDRQFPRDELEHWLRTMMTAKLNKTGPSASNATIDDLLHEVASAHRTAAQVECHQLLAQLPFPLFLSTNGDGLLAKTLKETPHNGQPKAPLVRTFNANEGPPPADFQMSAATPLVYHLFGNWQDTLELVLSEDDYFDFLIDFTRMQSTIPVEVRRRLTKASLLFVGFRLDEWDFRVLTRAINAMEGSHMLGSYSHVAVQVDPDTNRFLDVEKAFEFLRKHTQVGRKEISVFWGKPEEFLAQLVDRWNQAARG